MKNSVQAHAFWEQRYGHLSVQSFICRKWVCWLNWSCLQLFGGQLWATWKHMLLHILSAWCCCQTEDLYWASKIFHSIACVEAFSWRTQLLTVYFAKPPLWYACPGKFYQKNSVSSEWLEVPWACKDSFSLQQGPLSYQLSNRPRTVAQIWALLVW